MSTRILNYMCKGDKTIFNECFKTEKMRMLKTSIKVAMCVKTRRVGDYEREKRPRRSGSLIGINEGEDQSLSAQNYVWRKLAPRSRSTKDVYKMWRKDKICELFYINFRFGKSMDKIVVRKVWWVDSRAVN